MGGSHIDLDSTTFTDAYIKKPASLSNSQRQVIFRGPYADLSDITDPPNWLELNDIGNSWVYQPGGNGAVDAVYRNDQAGDAGSGHMNKVSIQWRSPDIGIELLSSGSVTNDRCFYWGQLLNIGTTGIKVEGGANNQFYVQPENGQGSATGYDLDTDCHDNIIYMTHRGCSTPMDIEGQGNHIRYSLPMSGPGTEILSNSNLAARPTNLDHSDQWVTHSFPWQADWTQILDTPGTGSVSINNFNRVLVEPSSNGDAQAVVTPTRLGNIAVGYLIRISFFVKTTTNAIYRLGVGSWANNWIGLEADTSNSNWHFKHVENGTVQTDVLTDTAKSIDGNKHRVTLNLNKYRQSITFDGEHIHTQKDTYGAGAAHQNLLIEAENNGGSSARLDLLNTETLSNV